MLGGMAIIALFFTALGHRHLTALVASQSGF